MKITINKKIIISYMAVIMVTLMCAGIFFSIAIRKYMEKQALDNLSKNASDVAGIISRDYNNDTEVSDAKIQQLIRGRLRKAFVGSDNSYAIITKELNIIYPRLGEESSRLRTRIIPAIRSKLTKETTPAVKITVDKTQYMIAIFPVKPNVLVPSDTWVVLYTPVGQVEDLLHGMFLVLLASLGLSAFLALIIGVIIARSIAKPIVTLKQSTEALSRRNFDTKVEIKTGDELEELADTVNKMAVELKEYDISQKKFLQNASHELKTPLMSIQGYAEGIKDGVFENNTHALDVIVDESKRLKGIVEEIIFLSKLETLEDFYSFKRENMDELIISAAEKVRSLALQRNISISISIKDNASLEVDNSKITQALINIIGNCIRYAKSIISINAAIKDKWYIIDIKDDGNGFVDKDIEHIFKRFFKGNNGNTGLGLAITKVIIDKHNGSIIAQNNTTGGANFIIKLPFSS